MPSWFTVGASTHLLLSPSSSHISLYTLAPHNNHSLCFYISQHWWYTRGKRTVTNRWMFVANIKMKMTSARGISTVQAIFNEWEVDLFIAQFYSLHPFILTCFLKVFNFALPLQTATAKIRYNTHSRHVNSVTLWTFLSTLPVQHGTGQRAWSVSNRDTTATIVTIDTMDLVQLIFVCRNVL